MKQKQRLVLGMMASIMMGIFASDPALAVSLSEPMEVVVPIPPLTFLAQHIGGDLVKPLTILPPGREPHTYTPLPGQIRRLGKASCFFYLGLPMEEDILGTLLPSDKLRVAPLAEGIDLRIMEHHCHHDHPDGVECEEGHHHEHHHHHDLPENLPDLEGFDPHLWLSPVNMIHFTEVMEKAFQEIDPEHAHTYRKNASNLKDELQELHGYLQQTLAPLKGEVLLVFHPAYGYFCDLYGLEQISVEQEGKAPKGKALKKLMETAKKKRITTLFVQPQFDKKAAQTVASAIKAEVVTFDPFPEDYIAYFRSMGGILEEKLGKKE